MITGLSRHRLSARRAALAVLALAAGMALPPRPEAGAAGLDPGAEKAARAYLRAMLDGDMPMLRRLAPKRLKNKFGPCRFAQMPRLTSARIDAHRGGVLFNGKTKDPQLPDEGGVTLTKLDHVRGNPWRVRRVLFFTELALGVKIPSRSVTRDDEAQEPLVREAARRYIAAWLKGDYQTMDRLAFDWLGREHDARRGVKIRKIEFRGTPSERGETKINFTAKITVFWVLPKTVDGTLFAIREDGEWKIRGNELTF